MSVTIVPSSNAAVQMSPQSMPAGELVIRALPTLVTVRVCRGSSTGATVTLTVPTSLAPRPSLIVYVNESVPL